MIIKNREITNLFSNATTTRQNFTNYSIFPIHTCKTQKQIYGNLMSDEIKKTVTKILFYDSCWSSRY